MLTKSVIAEHRILYVASSILAFVKVHPLCRPHFPYCSSLTCSSHATFFPPTLSVANCPSSLGSHSANRARTVHSIDRHVTSFGTRPGRSVEYTSRRHWCLIQPATVRLPSIRIDTRAGAARRRARFRRAAAQSRMRAMTVVVALEIEEFHLQIRCGPEQGAVQTLTTNRFNEPFNEGMGEWHVWDGLDFSDVENPQIGLPLVEAIQGIMIGAEVFRRGLASSRSIEHPAQRHAINNAAMDGKPHDATRALVHHDEHPVCAQDGRFASKEIETPQTVLRVPEEREPRRPSRVWCRVVPNGENAPHDILVDRKEEAQCRPAH
jgi:hypothetical protein